MARCPLRPRWNPRTKRLRETYDRDQEHQGRDAEPAPRGEGHVALERHHIAAITAEVFPCRRTDHSAEDNLTALQRVLREYRAREGDLRSANEKLRRVEEELRRTKAELHRPSNDGLGLSVAEHIAIVQQAQGIARTDHRTLVQAQRELAEARVEIGRLRRRARRRTPAISGRRVLGRRR